MTKIRKDKKTKRQGQNDERIKRQRPKREFIL